MRNKAKKEVKVVQAYSAEDFEKLVNQTLEKAYEESTDEPRIELMHNQGFCAFISYNTKVEIPETAEEEYRLAGEHHYCLECKYFDPPTDGRVKHTHCLFNGKLTRRERPCCDYFYEELSKGVDILKGGEDQYTTS